MFTDFSYSEFLIMASAHLLALLSPGPDFLLIIRSGMRYPFSIALGCCVGVTAANAVYILLCLFGYAALAAQSPDIQIALKIAGGSYLLWLGWQLLKSLGGDLQLPREQQQHSTFLKEFFIGLWASLLNPKISLFYFSLFTLVISDSTPLAIQAFYGIWMITLILLWDAMLVLLLRSATARQYLTRWLKKLEPLIGAVLLLAGLRVLGTL